MVRPLYGMKSEVGWKTGLRYTIGMLGRPLLFMGSEIGASAASHRSAVCSCGGGMRVGIRPAKPLLDRYVDIHDAYIYIVDMHESILWGGGWAVAVKVNQT